MYFLLPKKARNYWLLLVSLFFYTWGAPKFAVFLVGSIVFNYIMALVIDRIPAGRLKKALLTLAILGNLSILFVFKYMNFVTGTLLDWFPALGSVIHQTDFRLPIGISFFTFQALSYVVDVYRGTVAVQKNPAYVGLYISFFPQLIAGPIIQYNSVAQQIRARRTGFDMLSMGLCRFTVGLGKKVLLSNCFAAMADNIFGWSAIGVERCPVPATLAWLGSLAYSLQIYYDFSAYSDMAIGLGLCFGFRFGENFNYPYSACCVSDFWRRWHISLTSWFREYVYIPLGGNRVSNQDTMVRNLFIVWLLTGIWHGANWTFLFWGLYYFLLQLAERFFQLPKYAPGNPLYHLYTLLAVNTGWVIFRADNLYQAGRFFLNMLGLNRNGFCSDVAWMLLRENWVFLLLGVVFSMPLARNMNEYLYHHPKSALGHCLTVLYPLGLAALFVVSVCCLMSGTYNPFIYFNF